MWNPFPFAGSPASMLALALTRLLDAAAVARGIANALCCFIAADTAPCASGETSACSRRRSFETRRSNSSGDAAARSLGSFGPRPKSDSCLPGLAGGVFSACGCETTGHGRESAHGQVKMGPCSVCSA